MTAKILMFQPKNEREALIKKIMGGLKYEDAVELQQRPVEFWENKYIGLYAAVAEMRIMQRHMEDRRVPSEAEMRMASRLEAIVDGLINTQ